MNPRSARIATSPASAAIASATARAVWVVLARGEWTISSGSPWGTGRAGGACGRASRSPARAAWRSPAGDSGVSDWPWNRFSTIHSDSPWRSRTRVPSSPAGTIESGIPGSASVTGRSTSAVEPDDPDVDHGGIRLDRPDHRRRHVVVEREDHVRVGSRRGPGEGHRADVDVGLAEEGTDAADGARAVPVVADEHDAARREVHRVLLEPDEPRLAVRHRPREHDGLPVGLRGEREERRERPGVRRLAL